MKKGRNKGKKKEGRKDGMGKRWKKNKVKK